jgi:hypothetical protein
MFQVYIRAALGGPDIRIGANSRSIGGLLGHPAKDLAGVIPQANVNPT